MKTYNNANHVRGIKVSSKFRALFRRAVWTKFNLSDRNLLSSYKNYYDVNGFLTIPQYNILIKKYENHIENATEYQTMKES